MAKIVKKSVAELIAGLNPCDAGRAWAEGQKSPQAAWKHCKRGDWMAWLLSALNYRGLLSERAVNIGRKVCRDVAESVVKRLPKSMPQRRELLGVLKKAHDFEALFDQLRDIAEGEGEAYDAADAVRTVLDMQCTGEDPFDYLSCMLEVNDHHLGAKLIRRRFPKAPDVSKLPRPMSF